MILFLEDWNKYPRAIVHTKTSNKSYLVLAEKYKRMGVKNYAFHLALMQPELETVDPFDPNLTMEQMQMIGLECKHNPWYFFREVLRLKPQAGANPVPINANRGNIGLYWLFFNHMDMCLIQPRQTGKSVSTDGLMIYLIFIGTINTRINMVTKDNDLRFANVDRLKNMRNYLPKYLWTKSKQDSDNKTDVTCAQLNNIYATAVAQNSEAGALSLGRGTTSPIMHNDEGPFCNYIDVTLPAILASGGAARDEARREGAHYGNIFTTTAGKKDDRNGAYMYEMVSGGMTWDERALLDCSSQKQVEEIIEKNSTGQKPIVNMTFSHTQLGYDDQWLKEKLKNSNAKGEEADRDYFNVWTSGGLSSPLSVDLNKYIRESQKEPDHIEISKDGYIMRWYIPKHEIEYVMEHGNYILAMDTSEGVGRDAISMVIMDVRNLKVIAASDNSETNLIRFSNYVCDLLVKYRNVTLIPERRSTGQLFIDNLLHKMPTLGIDPFKRVYNQIVDEGRQHEPEFNAIASDPAHRPDHFYDRCKRYFGYTTSGSGRMSRDVLYGDILQQAASLGGGKVCDKRLIDEITGLVVKKGRIDHSSGSHDDMVIAWLLACWMLMSTRNLDFYGIRNALCEVEEFGMASKKPKSSDPYDLYLDQQQKLMREEMKQLMENLKSVNDDLLAVKVENRLRFLDQQLISDDESAFSLDKIITEAKEERMKRRKSMNSFNRTGRSLFGNYR